MRTPHHGTSVLSGCPAIGYSIVLWGWGLALEIRRFSSQIGVCGEGNAKTGGGLQRCTSPSSSVAVGRGSLFLPQQWHSPLEPSLFNLNLQVRCLTCSLEEGSHTHSPHQTSWTNPSSERRSQCAVSRTCHWRLRARQPLSPLSISQGELEWTGGHQNLRASLSALHQESGTPFSSWPSFWEDGSLGSSCQWYLSTLPNVGFLLIFHFSLNVTKYKYSFIQEFPLCLAGSWVPHWSLLFLKMSKYSYTSLGTNMSGRLACCGRTSLSVTSLQLLWSFSMLRHPINGAAAKHSSSRDKLSRTQWWNLPWRPHLIKTLGTVR